MTRTTFATESDSQAAMATWHEIDASKIPLGRMAARIAEILMGKHKPLYTPHILVGDGVIVTHAAQVVTTGNKRNSRTHTRYTGHPGGLRVTTLGEDIDHDPVLVVKRAVKRMLPKTRLGTRMLARLKVYPGESHPHLAQKPNKLELCTLVNNPYVWGTGRRKTSVARVRIKAGTGQFTVNGRPFEDFFTTSDTRRSARQPLHATETTQNYDVWVNVGGGGITGQADATRLGLARALLTDNPGLEETLRQQGLLTRDSRAVERKKCGQHGARRSTQFSKR